MTRPNISYAVQHVSQVVSSSTDVHHEVVKRNLCYLKGTIGHGLPICRSTDSSFLIAYSDVDWQVAWILSGPPSVSHSSAKVEYRASAYACADTIWIQGLLHELGHPITHHVILNCDNLSTTYLAANPDFHARTKHIAIDYHFVRERVALGSHQVCFMPSTHQLANVFTKGLPTDRFARLISKLVSSLIVNHTNDRKWSVVGYIVIRL
ncbi:unnamed protein product [Prunus armeniaca]